jgi:O-Antigen ligase
MWLVLLFVAEMVLAGPGYWHFAGIPIRRTLVATLTLWMLLMCVLGRAKLRGGHVVLIGIVAISMVLWIFMIPAARSSNSLSYAVQEGFPLALLFSGILTHAYYRNNLAAWAIVRYTAGLALGTVALIAIVVWAIGALLVDDPLLVALGFVSYFTLGSESVEPSIYVQQMPDGFFRVMWITSTLLPVGLIYSLAQRKLGASLLFSAALFASYTRALWLSALVGLVWLSFRYATTGYRVRINFQVVALVLLVIFGLAGFDLARGEEASVVSRAWGRLVTTFTDESASDRVDQIIPLVDAWLLAPILGLGMGSAAAISRSDVAPYLYELTYLALLMKIGIVGILIFSAMIAVLLLRTAAYGARVAHIEASVLAFLLACSTNPYLLNLVGLSLLIFLFIELDLAVRSSDVSSIQNKNKLAARDRNVAA